MVNNDIPYKNGTIKFTWIDTNTYEILHSKMFDGIEDALSYAESNNFKNDYLLFKLLQSDGNKYAWQLLPYGRHRQYVSGMRVKDNPVLKYGSVALMILGAYYISTLIIKQIKK
jgi:hypothetical protein